MSTILKAEDTQTIVDITDVPKHEVAALHLKYFPATFTGLPGRKLLEMYYEALAAVEDAFGWVAVIDGKIVGFACAIRSKKAIQCKLLTRFPLRVFYWTCIQVLSKPGILMNLLTRLTQAGKASKQWTRPKDWHEWYAYRPLVVDERYRQYHLADLLTERVIEEVQKRGAPGLMGIVERLNSQSRVTHIRNGFREMCKDHDSIVYVREFERLAKTVEENGCHRDSNYLNQESTPVSPNA